MTPNPDGWYAVALSHEIAPGQLVPVSCFGQELVVWRTDDGEMAVFDAYCPHLGAHLGHGALVDGGCVVCPFHQWRFGADGRCTGIPYSDHIPPQAALRRYPVRERNGAILVWHHHAGVEPYLEIPELPSEGWTPMRWETFAVEMHIIDIGENGVDVGHFPIVHGCGRAGLELLDVVGPPFRFDLFTSYPGDGIGIPGQFIDVTTEWHFHCPGVFLAITSADAFGTRARQLFHFTPIPGDRVLYRVGISIDERTVPTDLHELVYRRNAELLRQNFDQDRTIWKYKTYHQRPALCDGDASLMSLRRYFRRFYPELPAELGDPTRRSHPRRMLRRFAPIGATPSPSPPAKQVDVARVRESFLTGLGSRFRPEEAGELDFTIQYVVLGGCAEEFVVRVAERVCRVEPGRAVRADLRIDVDAESWLEIQAGSAHPMAVMSAGKLSFAGDVGLAMSLARMFPVETP
jgi:phenylpropionate dioxygenase-like ring-hydroxylating dioxygenase large terminal subunit/putative sterol carrier protein